MTMSSDQLGDMSDLLSAIQSDIQRSAKDEEESRTSQEKAEPSLHTQTVTESAFNPASSASERADPQQETPVYPGEQQGTVIHDDTEELVFDPHNPDGFAYAGQETSGQTQQTSAQDPADYAEAEVLHNDASEAGQDYAQAHEQDQAAPAHSTEALNSDAYSAESFGEPSDHSGGQEVQAATTTAGVGADIGHADEEAAATSGTAGQDLEFATDFGSDAGQQTDDAASFATAGQGSGDAAAASSDAATVDPSLSLLVPSDAVAFATDAESRAVITALFGAGSESRVLEGDISATISYLTENSCPSMIIVDLSTSSDPMSELDGLADVCTPGTVVLTLGATNDINLYRQLRSAGVADYVVKPLSGEVLAEAIRSSMEPQMAAGAAGTVQGKLICVVGARGGVGATTIATNCATLIADEVGKKVGLIDFDLQFGTVALTLDMETSSGLSEAIENPSRVDATFIDSVSVRAGDKLFVIASEDGIEDHAAAAPENVAEFLNQLRNEFEAVVVDVPRHLAARWMRAFSNVSKMMVVTDLSLPGLRDTGRLLAAAKDVIEPKRILMVANRVGGDKYGGIDQDEFESAIERKFDFVVADDGKAAGAAARAGKPIVQVGKDGKLAGNIRDICGALVKKPAAAAGDKSKKKKSKFKLPFIGGKEE